MPCAWVAQRDKLPVASCNRAAVVHWAPFGKAFEKVTTDASTPQVFCNRDCILKTFTERGLDYIGEMALQNCRDLEPILWWNYEHGVRLFRCRPSSSHRHSFQQPACCDVAQKANASWITSRTLHQPLHPSVPQSC